MIGEHSFEFDEADFRGVDQCQRYFTFEGGDERDATGEVAVGHTCGDIKIELPRAAFLAFLRKAAEYLHEDLDLDNPPED